MHTGLGVGIRHADLGLKSVGISEEEAEYVAEVSDEPIRRLPSEEPIANLIECFQRRRFERHMVQSPSPEHGHLTLMLGVTRQLEDVQFCGRPDPNDGQLEPLALLQHLVRGVEDAAVELDEPSRVTGQHGNVVDTT